VLPLPNHFRAYHRSTYRDSGKESLRYICDNDSDKEDDSVEPEVVEDEGDDEEGDSEEDRHSCDQVDEVTNLTSDRGLSGLQTRRQVRDSTHDGAITCADDDASARPYVRHTRVIR